MEKQEHPDLDRWWDRKWKLAVHGGICAIISILLGMVIVLVFGPEYADAIRPLATAGMWGGIMPLMAFAAEAAVENIANMRKH